MQTHDTGNRAKKPKVSYGTSSGNNDSLLGHVPTASRTALRISPFEQECSEFQNIKQKFSDKNNIFLQTLNAIIQSPILQDDVTLQEHTKELIENYNKYNNVLNKFQNKIDDIKTNLAAQESELNTIKTINKRLKLLEEKHIDNPKPRLYTLLKESIEFHQDLDRVKKRINAVKQYPDFDLKKYYDLGFKCAAQKAENDLAEATLAAGITPCNADYMTALQNFLNNASQ